ncbi:MAG TPA: hypothetical protein VH092_34180, partial [Urbifossiella sp.]|nr:hypothetical protein [Urbifossiella sp.]
MPVLSLAHIVPEALGGVDCTLACTACNNGNGARFEADLANRFRYEDWGNGGGGWPARLSGVFGDVGVEFARTDATHWTLEVVHRQTNPVHLAALKEWLRARGEGRPVDTKWNISWLLRSRRREANAAVYQSAYLLMFSYFGYDFAFRGQYERLREQILLPERSSWPGHITVLPNDPWAGRLGRRAGAVLFVREPEPCVAVLLRFRPLGGRDRVFCVLLPAP